MTEEQAWEILTTVQDPEIPVVSVVEMGIIRAVEVEGGTVKVSMTPTFSGCPALEMMRTEIIARLMEAGAGRVEVRTVLSPPWSTEWITPEARRKLKEFGLAPPPRPTQDLTLTGLEVVTCPYCGSQDTTLKNSFGPTLCRAIFYCNACRQPFEQFKPL